jgi:hypothetical protein
MTGPVVFSCPQGSAEWFACRVGIPTASMFATVMAKGKEGNASKTRHDYMLRLAAEILTGEPSETYSNGHMERGKTMESEARDLYAFQTDADPEAVGFIRNGDKGCSPDSLIGNDGVLEVKTKLPHLLLECMLKDKFPAEHVAQCQGALWVCEREWVDIACYWPKLDLFVKRAYRDEKYIKQLSDAVDAFNAELALTVERIRSRSEPSRLKRQLTESLNILMSG